jgi:Methyltransferase domain
MIGLLLGRFHALTAAQAELVASLAQEAALERLVCVVTSADHTGTRRNPLDAATREEILRPDDAQWVAHVRAAVPAGAGIDLAPAETTLVSANRDVQAQLRTDDGELSAHRDFATYGAQMDASLAQKVADFLPWVVPPRIVDKGCGTGKLLVELSRRFPGASLVGVDLSREFLPRSDENTYAGGDVELILGDLCKKDCVKNWDIEVHEEYGALTVEEWRAALERAGFDVCAIQTYVNEWIRDHRYRDTVKVTELDGRPWWPPTNALVIGQKR